MSVGPSVGRPVRPSVRLSVRPSVGPSVRWSSVIFNQQKKSFPILWWRRNLIWTKRQSRTIHKWHQNVGPSVCLSIRQKKMNEKCRRGSRILWTPRFLFPIFGKSFELQEWGKHEMKKRRRTVVQNIWKWLRIYCPIVPTKDLFLEGITNLFLEILIESVVFSSIVFRPDYASLSGAVSVRRSVSFTFFFIF